MFLLCLFLSLFLSSSLLRLGLDVFLLCLDRGAFIWLCVFVVGTHKLSVVVNTDWFRNLFDVFCFYLVDDSLSLLGFFSLLLLAELLKFLLDLKLELQLLVLVCQLAVLGVKDFQCTLGVVDL